MTLSNIFFNTQHAPTGAHASLTLGFPGARGGMDLELCRAPNQSILVAVESRTVMPSRRLPAGTALVRSRAWSAGSGPASRASSAPRVSPESGSR